MSRLPEKIEDAFCTAFNKNIIPALENFTNRNPIPQPLLESIRNRTSDYSLVRVILETMQEESAYFIDTMGLRGRNEATARIAIDLVQTWYPFLPRVATEQFTSGLISPEAFDVIKVIDFVTSSPEASRRKESLDFASSINQVITLGGKRFKRFYAELDSPQA